MQCQIALPPRWVNASALEAAIQKSGNPHGPGVYEVLIQFPVRCKLMIDAAIRLLSLSNQLAHTTCRLRLDFEEGESGTMGYLNRMGFFDHLPAEVEVIPYRPAYSGAELYRGGNTGLVEIAQINKDARDRELPTRLTEVLMRSCGQRPDAAELEGAAWTIFAELIDNVFSHSQTPLDGYAALQVYKGGDRLIVAVSDSGLGIMETLRPALQNEFPRLVGLSDVDLLVEVFRQGLSRHGPDRGCGLKGSAAKAMKFHAELDVRLPTQRVLLTPARGAYRANTAHCYDQLPLLRVVPHRSYGGRRSLQLSETFKDGAFSRTQRRIGKILLKALKSSEVVSRQEDTAKPIRFLHKIVRADNSFIGSRPEGNLPIGRTRSLRSASE